MITNKVNENRTKKEQQENIDSKDTCPKRHRDTLKENLTN